MDAVKKLTGEARTAPLKPAVQATYDYCDSQGVLLYQVVRYTPKGFRLRRRTETGWAWCLDGMRRVLYRLPELLERSDETIYYVEGEKDVETLFSEVRAWLLQHMPRELTALNLACLILSGPLVAASLLFLTWMSQVRH